MITKLKIAIDKSGLKQTYISRKTKIDYALLSRYVRGAQTVPENDAKKIANVLKIQIEDVL